MDNLIMDPALLGKKFKFYQEYAQDKEIVHTILGFYMAEAQIYCVHAAKDYGVQSTVFNGSNIYQGILKYEEEEREKKSKLDGPMSISCERCNGTGKIG